MPDFDEYEATFAVEGGIFGVGRLATRLKQLSDTDIGQWIDFHHTAIRIRFGTVDDRQTAIRACINATI